MAIAFVVTVNQQHLLNNAMKQQEPHTEVSNLKDWTFLLFQALLEDFSLD